MRITVVGTGYVGLVVGACLAETGNDVHCDDVDVAKIEGLKKNVLPIYEPGLDELVERNQSQGRLEFTTDVPAAIAMHRHAVYAPALVVFVGGNDDRDSRWDGRRNVAWFPLAPNEVYRPAYHASDRYVRRVDRKSVV